MATSEYNVRRLEIIANGLGQLAADAIFIGGACTHFYVEDPALHDFRPTADIDCIVKISTYNEFTMYCNRLRECGFSNDTTGGAPIVRWVYRNIPVDILPDECSVVGYRNIRWFSDGRIHAEERTLPSGKVIRILPPAYYLATKLESWEDRGDGDFFASKDIEDIIGVIDGNDNLDRLLRAPENVRDYVIGRFAHLIRNEDFKRAIAGHIGFDETASARAADIVGKIAAVVDGCNV